MMFISELLQQKRIIAETRKQLDEQERKIDLQIAYLTELAKRRRERDKEATLQYFTVLKFCPAPSQSILTAQ